MKRPENPWHIEEVSTCQANGGLHVVGRNDYTGARFSWAIGGHGLLWTWSARYDTSEAVWGPGARDRAALLLRRERRLQRQKRTA